MWADVTLPTPPGTDGWKLDFVFFSSEFPEWVGRPFNDMFIVWVETPEYVGNQCFVGGEPCTVTALASFADAYGGANNLDFPGRAGTGLNTTKHTNAPGGNKVGGENSGQTTGWNTMSGPATPDQDLRLAFILFDMADALYDTTVVIDDFRWDCVGCIPGLPVEDGGCGIIPQ
jgi:hypothetical protein